MHNVTPIHGELAGIAWLREWQLPYEGAYTLLLKFAVANGIGAGELCGAVFGQKLNQAPTYGQLHARSLLDSHWIDQTGENGIAAIRRLTIESTLSARAGRWTSLIATDKSLRYCPDCLRHGYQSFLYQIEAIARCPIHGVPILANCTACGLSTPPYALAEAGFGIPFHCPSCLTPYAEQSEISQWGNHRLYADAARLLSPLVKWVQSLNASTLNWRDWHTWHLPVSSLTAHETKRRATLQVLTSAIPPNFDLACLDLGTLTFNVYKGCYENISCAVALKQMNQESSPEMYSERIQLYKAVRRRLARVTQGYYCGARASMNRQIKVHPGDGAMVLSTESCPRIQVFMLWRYHFEEMLANRPVLELRTSLLQWPLDKVLDAKAWVGYLLASFHAAEHAFSSWHEAATKLTDASVTGDDRVRARELHATFASIVTPLRQPNFPAVSFLTYVSEKGAPVILLASPRTLGRLACADARGLISTYQDSDQQHRKLSPQEPASLSIEVIGTKKMPERPLVRKEYFQPLDMIRLSPSLDGSDLQAKLRALSPTAINAKNDLEAIQLWLEYYTSEKTRKNYIIQIQKVLLWCVAQRNIALSAMTTVDVDAFTEFLADPKPRDIWLPTKLYGKARPWSPMRAVHSAVTQEHVLTVISVLFKRWSAWGYIRGNPFDHSKFSQRQAQKLLLEGAGVWQPTERFLSAAEWRYLATAVPEHSVIPLPAVRFILFMAYYGALKPSEIGCIKLGDLHLYKGGGSAHDICSVRINSRKPAQQEVFLLEPVAHMISSAIPVTRSLLDRYLVTNRDNWLRHLFGIEYAGISADDPAIMANRLGVALKPVFQAAAELAMADGDQKAAQRLRQATLIWVTSSLWHHVPDSLVTGPILWTVLGTKTHMRPENRAYVPSRISFNHKLVQEQMATLKKAIDY